MKPILRYVESRLDENRREFAYRIFVTDCLGHLVGAKNRYYDMVTDKPVETRTADEIISNISNKLEKIGGE